MNKNNASVYFSEEQHDQVTRAAARAGKPISEYIRDLVAPWAASDLHEEPAPSPSARPQTTESAIAQAARLHGMKITDYRKLAAELQAREDLGLPRVITERPAAPRAARTTIVPPARPRRPPRRAAASGQYRRAG
jgi:uncharacterized protein (DUF1778 family)